MKMMKLAAGIAASLSVAAPALAQDLHFPSLSYRTGAFASGGIPFADGYADYFTLLNERDGGIGGVPVRVTECETAYATDRGVECYQSIRGDSPLVIQPLSTGITYQLIPRVTEDGIPLVTSGYGRTSAMDGNTFRWVFNFPANYWDGASIAVNYLLEQNDGSLADKKIILLYHNSAYGREPIPTLERLAADMGFEFIAIPIDSPGQEQSSQWLQVRRERPDYVLLWGWGVMNQVAVQEAANIRFPMDHFIGIWWSGSEQDVIPAGDGADGYLALNFAGVGTDYPLYEDLQTYVFDRGLAAGNGDQIGTVPYSRGIYAAMLAAEGARNAQEIHGVAQITSTMMRDGLEAIDITEERLAELGLPGFSSEFSVDCRNHGGSGQAVIQQWSAADQRWNIITDWMQSDRELITELALEDSAAYAAENNIPPQCN